MSDHGLMLKNDLKRILHSMGLLSAVRRIFNLPIDPQEGALYQRFLRYKRQNGRALRIQLEGGNAGSPKTCLVFGKDYPVMEPELGLIKALETANYVPVVLMHRESSLTLECYRLAVKRFLFWEELLEEPDLNAAQTILERYHSMRALAGFNYAGARVGLFAISTTLRDLRIGSLDWNSPDQQKLLVRRLASSIRYTRAALKMIQEIHPDILLFLDGVYTPEAELVDVCVENGVSAVCWHPAHKNNALILKRYSTDNKSADRSSLSKKTWEFLQNMPWSDRQSRQLDRELYSSYATGAWYADAGTQFHKQLLEPAQVTGDIGLDPNKKTAFIFPHIMWDASLSKGEDLFRDYQDWFVQTVRAACLNQQVNWVIKIHPAHVGKAAQDGFQGEPAEVTVLHQEIGQLPSHVFFIPADSPISTYSLFPVMDYCLTVRGTIGMEAARLGIPVITAGTGRYDHRGFTVDFGIRGRVS